MTLGVSWDPCTFQPIPGELPQDSLCFSSMLDLFESLHFLYNVTFLRLRINPELGLKGRNSSYCARLLGDGFDALLFSQFSNMHLFTGLRIHYCLGVLISLYLSHEMNHLRLHRLTSDVCHKDRLQIFFTIDQDKMWWCTASNSVLLIPWRKWWALSIQLSTIAMTTRLPTIIWYSLWSATYLSQSHSFYHHSMSSAAFFLLLQPTWPFGQGQEIAYGQKRT